MPFLLAEVFNLMYNYPSKIAIVYDDFRIEGISYEEIIYKMSQLDWENPASNIDFKRNVGQRMVIMGKPIIFWDARSFLYALFAANIIDAILEEYPEEVSQ